MSVKTDFFSILEILENWRENTQNIYFFITRKDVIKAWAGRIFCN